MNFETQIDGERLAKSVAARATALEVINARSPILSWWQLPGILITGILSGWLVAQRGTGADMVLAISAVLGVIFGINACVQCIVLRKRVDAILVLLNASEQR